MEIFKFKIENIKSNCLTPLNTSGKVYTLLDVKYIYSKGLKHNEIEGQLVFLVSNKDLWNNKSNVPITKWFEYGAILSSSFKNLKTISIPNDKINSEEDDSGEDINGYRVINEIGIKNLIHMKISDLLTAEEIKLIPIDKSLSSKTHSIVRKRISLLRTPLTSQYIGQLSKDLIEILMKNQNFVSYIRDLRIFERYNKLSDILESSSKNWLWTMWESNLSNGVRSYDQWKTLKRNKYLTNFSLLQYIFESNLEHKLLIPTIGEVIINDFYTTNLIALKKASETLFISSNIKFVLYSCFTKSLIKSFEIGDETSIHINTILTNAFRFLKLLKVKTCISKRMCKNIMNDGILSSGMDVWATLVFCYEDSPFIISLCDFLNDCINHKCISIYKISTDSGLDELKFTNSSTKLKEYKIVRHHTLDNMKIINQSVTNLINTQKSDVEKDLLNSMRAEINLNSSSKYKLTKSQSETLESVCSNKYIQITGEGGTGKTFIISSILKLLSTLKYSVLIVSNYCMSTNVLKNKIGREFSKYSSNTDSDTKDGDNKFTVDIRTMESASFNYNSNSNRPSRLPDCIIIDEAQNNCNAIRAKLLKLNPNVKMLIEIGDEGFQILPIGYGNPMYDIYRKFSNIRCTLTDNMRIESENQLFDFLSLLRSYIQSNYNGINSSADFVSEASSILGNYNKNENTVKRYSDIKKRIFIFEENNFESAFDRIFTEVTNSFRPKKKFKVAYGEYPIRNWYLMSPTNADCNKLNSTMHVKMMKILHNESVSFQDTTAIPRNKKYLKVLDLFTKKNVKVYEGSKIVCTENYNYSIVGSNDEILKKKISVVDLFKNSEYDKILKINEDLENSFISSPISNRELNIIKAIRYKKLESGEFLMILTLVSEIDPKNQFVKEIVIKTHIGHIDPLHIKLGYFTTIHSTLGGEQDRCIAYIPPTSVYMVTSEIMYTMISRSKKTFRFVGFKSQVDSSIRRKIGHIIQNRPVVELIDVIVACCSFVKPREESDTFKFDLNVENSCETNRKRKAIESIQLQNKKIKI